MGNIGQNKNPELKCLRVNSDGAIVQDKFYFIYLFIYLFREIKVKSLLL